MQPTVSISQQQVRQLENTILRTIRESKKSVSGAMIQASVFASQSAAKGTPQAKKNRPSKRYKSKRVMGNKTRDKKGVPWWAMGSVDIWKDGKEQTQFFRSELTFQKARAVPRRGLGKSVWKASAIKKPKTLNNATLSKRYSVTQVRRSADMITGIKMTNALK